MAHHGDAGADQPFDHRNGLRFGAFHLHAGRIGLLQKASCSRDCAIETALVAQERQIGDHQRLLRQRLTEAPADRLRVQQHLLECDRQCGAVAEADHRQGVTHQHHVSTGGLHEGCAQGIPGREHGDRLPGLLEPDQVGGAQPIVRTSGRPLLALQPTRTHAVRTPKPGQNRKAAATRDAQDRRGLRVTKIKL